MFFGNVQSLLGVAAKFLSAHNGEMGRIFGVSAFLRLLVIGVVALGLWGCGPSLSGMYKLSKVDLETTDIAQLRFAVQLPKRVLARLRQIELGMRLHAVNDQPETGELFFLKPVQSTLALSALQQYQRADAAVRIYRIADEDIARFNAIRTSRDNTGAKRDGEMSLTAQLCRDPSAADQPVFASTFFFAAETGEFVPLMLNFDVGKAMEEAGRPIAVC